MTKLSQKEIDIFSKKILEDYDANNPGTIFKDKIKINNADALVVQSAVSELRKKRGEEIIGYKIGCTGPGTTKLFGMQGPIRGMLFESEVHECGVELSADLFNNLAVEAEMAIKIGKNGTIQSIFPVIELHNFVFRAPKK